MFKINVFEQIKVNARLKLHGRSDDLDLNGKPKWEVKQYVGNKDPKVVSRYDIIRNNGITKILHRLYREGKGWVHKHWK